MKRISMRLATLALLVSALFVVTSSNAPTVGARDACTVCLGKVQALYEACVDLYGEIPYCGDPIFNDGIIFCYATVCEQ